MNRPLKVIVVEDDESLRAMFSATLRSDPGIVTAEAADLPEAVLLCQQERQVVLLVDPGLPSASGVVAVERLHKTLPGATLVVVTGDITLKDAALAAGATDVIVKGTVQSHNQGLLDAIRKAVVAHDVALQFSPSKDILDEIHRRLRAVNGEPPATI